MTDKTKEDNLPADLLDWQSHRARHAEALRRMEHDLAEALRDSERLDWLEDRSDIDIWPLWWVEVCEGKFSGLNFANENADSDMFSVEGDTLRATIDAAMLAPKGAHKEK